MEYSPPRVCENSVCKLLWDFSIVSDVPLQHNRPDITYILKNNNEVFLIDIAIPGDSRLSHKFAEKHSKYIDLKVEVTRVWRVKRVSTIPIIVVEAIRPVPDTDFTKLFVRLGSRE